MHLNAIIDTSHFNGDIDFQAVAGDGILGIIQKATQGRSYIDRTYARNRVNATNAGLLWGAYHFGTGDDGIAQAEHFLSVVGNFHNVLLALDFEENPDGPSMNLDQARAFLMHVQARTGRFPGLYGGSYLKDLLGDNSDPVLVQCWLWIAEYGPAPIIPPNWRTWTFWQYTDGQHGLQPKTVDGVGPCDRDCFNGPERQLRKLWLS